MKRTSQKKANKSMITFPSTDYMRVIIYFSTSCLYFQYVGDGV